MDYKNNKGFTLIEIILTISILSIIIIPLTSMFLQSARINSQASLEYNAMEVAQRYMEEIKAQNKYDASKYGNFDDEDGVEWLAPDADTSPFKVKVNIVPYTTSSDNTNKNNTTDPINVCDLCVKEFDNGYIGIKTRLTAGTTVMPNVLITNRSDSLNMDLDFYKDGDNIKLRVKHGGTSIDYDIEDSTDLKVDVYPTCNITIVVNNTINQEIKFNVIKDIDTEYDCSLQVVNGEVRKKTNIKTQSLEKLSNYILYKVTVSVSYKGEEVANIEGYKVFDK